MTNDDMRTIPEIMETLSPPLKEILGSVELNKSESGLSGNGQRLKKCPSLPAIQPNPEFRRKLFELDESPSEKIISLSCWGEWFLRRALNNVWDHGRHLVLSGATGTGKTHVASKVYGQVQAWGVDAALSAGWNGRFPFSLWTDWRRRAECDHRAFEDWLPDLTEAEIVFIDDIGAESDRFRSGEGASKLHAVLSKCERKWLLVTTNLSQPEFMRTYDARIADRLSAAHWCDMSGVPSYRPKLAGK